MLFQVTILQFHWNQEGANQSRIYASYCWISWFLRLTWHCENTLSFYDHPYLSVKSQFQNHHCTLLFFCQENIQNFLGQMLETRDQRMLWWWSLSWNFNQRWHALFCECWLQSSLHQQLGHNAACGVHLSEFTTGRTVAVQALPSHASQHILLQSATWVTDDTLKNN